MYWEWFADVGFYLQHRVDEDGDGHPVAAGRRGQEADAQGRGECFCHGWFIPRVWNSANFGRQDICKAGTVLVLFEDVPGAEKDAE